MTPGSSALRFNADGNEEGQWAVPVSVGELRTPNLELRTRSIRFLDRHDRREYSFADPLVGFPAVSA
jgi:hypothetical protein